jgi:hypothetical protein
MPGYGAKEARINKERQPRVNLCTCGKEIDNGALLCQDCYEEIHGQSNTEVNEGREVS